MKINKTRSPECRREKNNISSYLIQNQLVILFYFEPSVLWAKHKQIFDKILFKWGQGKPPCTFYVEKIDLSLDIAMGTCN